MFARLPGSPLTWRVRWIFPEPLAASAIEALARQFALPPFAARLLLQRGCGDPARAAEFLDPRLRSLRDPFLLPDMEAAVTRLLAALDAREKIVLYGDYDVDGVTSLTLLARVLRAMGAEPACFLPHRMDEGYGLSEDGVARCLEEHRPKLLIAVDCGTTSTVEIAGLTQRGVDVIVLDHHECGADLPRCVAVVNPKRGESDHHLCSAGLAFKLAHALLKRRPVESFDLREVLDLVALGTVADLVPLLDENRILVKHGLQRLAQSRWVGLRALVAVAGLKPPFLAGTVSFGFGPRLNAAGRLGTALDSLELLLTDDPFRARAIAEGLDRQNRERRAVEDQVLKEAEAQLAEWFDPARHAAIVAGSADWHPGVIGIVAARLQRRYYRPTVVVSFDPEGMGKGSGRSIAGLPLVTALGACAGDLVRFGGHAMAAGLSVAQERFTAFRERFLTVAQESLASDQLQPTLQLDAEVALRDVNKDFLTRLEALEPFGSGHRAPLFFAREVYPAAEPRVLKEKHLSFLLHHRGWETRAIWFGSAQEALPEPPWDIAFEVTRNDYQGRVTPQIQISALRAAGSC